MVDEHIALCFNVRLEIIDSCVNRVHPAVQNELIIARGSQAAHLKDDVPIFQNFQQNQKSVEIEIFLESDDLVTNV